MTPELSNARLAMGDAVEALSVLVARVRATVARKDPSIIVDMHAGWDKHLAEFAA